jgi:hypothetical protein
VFPAVAHDLGLLDAVLGLHGDAEAWFDEAVAIAKRISSQQHRSTLRRSSGWVPWQRLRRPCSICFVHERVGRSSSLDLDEGGPTSSYEIPLPYDDAQLPSRRA